MYQRDGVTIRWGLLEAGGKIYSANYFTSVEKKVHKPDPQKGMIASVFGLLGLGVFAYLLLAGTWPRLMYIPGVAAVCCFLYAIRLNLSQLTTYKVIVKTTNEGDIVIPATGEQDMGLIYQALGRAIAAWDVYDTNHSL
nr:DUF6232 family protein [Ectobacillus ponti]